MSTKIVTFCLILTHLIMLGAGIYSGKLYFSSKVPPPEVSYIQDVIHHRVEAKYSQTTETIIDSNNVSRANTIYTAYSDTSNIDSTFIARVTYNSLSPLPENGYFNNEYIIKQKLQEDTKLYLNLNGGLIYINKQTVPTINVGILYKL